MAITLTTAEDFEKVVLSESLVVVEFFAEWCSPCQKMEKFLEDLMKDSKYTDKKILFYRINVDTLPGIAKMVGIGAIPTFVCYRDNRKLDESVGASKSSLKKMLKKHM
ncbi:Thioredoxin [Galdieria sulphuraria]|uniref:Thioredoxin n=1 Tax=Galdieria sulphuraria TaxID=130081 RepID=M2VW97_GALSU|nr:thioredoxin 1 [Galdieria sulphuraria]EME27516.1 thioredoxin 1 [Galdieria sulphuraria]GJD06427.1 Thioredoxin [Galdieria sulphuraria]|eukprot:XP_005704036.1 thioredoxin 1 [Galdieria sulphuraria]